MTDYMKELARLNAFAEAKPVQASIAKRCGTCRLFARKKTADRGECYWYPTPSSAVYQLRVEKQSMKPTEGTNCPAWED